MDYIGTELELFSHANNWKNYSQGKFKKYIQGDILEVGGGIGSNTTQIINENVKSLTFLEPDTALLNKAKVKITDTRCTFLDKITSDLGSDHKQKYDALIYLDVLEHIEDDYAESKVAYDLLKKGGHLIILVPAHQFLYSSFDKAIGHFRRYDRKMLSNAICPEFEKVSMQYLDSVGLFASLANRLFLKQSAPTKKQISLWDNTMVPLSTIGDKITLGLFGKSILAIYRK